MAVIVLVVLLQIVVDRITLLGVILLVLTGKVVTANILTKFEVIELGVLNDVGNVSLLDTHLSFESLHFPLARLTVHNVTCLLFWPPNINPYPLILGAELHSK